MPIHGLSLSDKKPLATVTSSIFACSSLTAFRRSPEASFRHARRAVQKRLYRLYCEEGLSIRTRSPKRRRACRHRSGRSEVDGMNNAWAMDFMSDRLFDKRPSGFRPFWIVLREKLLRPLQGPSSEPFRSSKSWIDWHGSETSRAALG